MSRQLTTSALAFAGSIASFSFVGVSQANAATLVFTNPVAPNPITQGVTEIDQTFQLPKFDPSLGTLTGVSLHISGAFTQSFTATNRATQAQNNVRIITSTELLFSLVGAGAPSIPDSLEFGANTGFLNYNSGETKSFGPFLGEDTVTGIVIDPANFAFFTGSGDFSFNCVSASGVLITGGGGNIDSTQNTTAGCGGSVEYTFETPVVGTPEPSTMLGILAVAGAGALARRKS